LTHTVHNAKKSTACEHILSICPVVCETAELLVQLHSCKLSFWDFPCW